MNDQGNKEVWAVSVNIDKSVPHSIRFAEETVAARQSPSKLQWEKEKSKNSAIFQIIGRMITIQSMFE